MAIYRQITSKMQLRFQPRVRFILRMLELLMFFYFYSHALINFFTKVWFNLSETTETHLR